LKALEMSDSNDSENTPGSKTRSKLPQLWKKGQSGNPGGRPRLEGEIRRLAQSHGKRAIRRLAQLLKSENERVAVTAAQILLDRGFGKAPQAITGPDGGPLMPAMLVGISAEPISDAIHAGMAYEQLMRNPSMDLASISFEPAALPAPQEAAVAAITVEPSQGIKRAAIASHVEAAESFAQPGPIGGELRPRESSDDGVPRGADDEDGEVHR
jgi:Family of unknown function (DUF5681)